jgi:hypothetical protein
MTTREKVGTVIILLGIGAVGCNYLWLIGVIQKPPDDLMTARWIFSGILFMFGAIIGWAQ